VTVGTERRSRWILADVDVAGAGEVEHGDDCRSSRSSATGLLGRGVAVSFVAFVAVTFLFGWLSGLLLVLKSWHLLPASRVLMISGAGYVTLMLIPIMCGFVCARIAGHLVRRGWSGLPLRMLALGVCGLVAGVMAI
jgi:hypothetical protein